MTTPSVLVDHDRLDLDPVSAGNGDLLGNRGVLHGDPVDAAGYQCTEQEIEAVQKPQGEDQVVEVDSHPADA
jgi:hypothetical protein